MLPPNMAPWCIEYFRLREFEKEQKQEGHSDPLLHTPFSEQIIRDEDPPSTQRKGTSLSLRQSDPEKNANRSC